MGSTRVYVGNLPLDVTEKEIDDIFYRYGKIDAIDIKGGREGTSRFAFIEFADPRDAREAVDGQEFARERLRVRCLGHIGAVRVGACRRACQVFDSMSNISNLLCILPVRA
jgi:RNA recognition motif-containing protein